MPLTYREPSIDQNGMILQNTLIFMNMAVRTTNLASSCWSM